MYGYVFFSVLYSTLCGFNHFKCLSAASLMQFFESITSHIQQKQNVSKHLGIYPDTQYGLFAAAALNSVFIMLKVEDNAGDASKAGLDIQCRAESSMMMNDDDEF